MAGAARKNERRFSYADYLSWDDDNRYEIIDGTVYDMNAPLRLHQKFLVELVTIFHNHFRDKTCEVYMAPFDVRLPKKSKRDEDIFDVVQPDLSVICDPAKLDDKGCVGAPDLVVEIVSPSTASHDQIRKRALYEERGVREFWLLHPQDRILSIYLLADGRFGRPEIFGDDAEVCSFIFPELCVDLKMIFPPLEKKVCQNPPPGYQGRT
jgi:Uma2 family endonuclease